MPRRCTLDGLDAAISEILEEYEEDVIEGTTAAVEYATKKGAKAARSASPKKSGGYASGWKAKVTKGRVGATGVIYNAKKPGLAHLLEHGHAKISGGREYPEPVPARVHLKPIQDQVDKVMEEQVKIKIGGQ